VDWTTIATWIIQGVILFGFATLGVILGQRLFNRPTPVAPPAKSTETPPPPPVPEPFTAPIASAPPPASSSSQTSSDLDIQRAVEFSESGRMLLVLDMPAALLDDDKALIDAWIESVGWARVERQRMDRGEPGLSDDLATAGAPLTALDPTNVDPEVLGTQLNQVLNRLQVSAERRRHFRALLEQNFPADDEE